MGDAPVRKHRGLSYHPSLEMAIPEEIWIFRFDPLNNFTGFLTGCLGVNRAGLDLKQHKH